MDREARLQAVASAAELDLRNAPVVSLPSDSNDAWRIGNRVLRVCWRGDRDRLRREAALLEGLPDAVPHARVLGVGGAADLTWMTTEWIDGEPLAGRWDSLRSVDRQLVATQLAHILRSLHEWAPDPRLRDRISMRHAQSTIDEIVGADVNPLPVDRAQLLIETAGAMPHANRVVLEQLRERLDELRPVDSLQMPANHVIHGDAHLGNLLWRDGQIVALLDFEWARLGPPDLELQPLLRPEDGHPGDLLAPFIAAYGSFGDDDHLVQRLWLYDLAFTLRHLIVWPARAPSEELPPYHPLRRLPTIVKSPHYIEQLLG